MTYIPGSQLGRGATLTITPLTTGATAIATLSLVSITPPAPTVGEVENTLLSTTFKPYLATLPEGEGSFKLQHWDGDPGCVALQTAVAVAPIPSFNFLLTLMSGATLAWTGYPKKYAIDEIENEGIVMAEVDYRQNTVAIYTPAGGGTASNF